MRIGKIASSAEYRMDEQSQNLLIFKILIVFWIEKNSGNLLILQFWNFQKIPIYKITKISEISKLP